jgi:uncharacterized damage-inducible protein DinB
MESEIQKIISLLRRTFEKDAWHGPSVKEVLNGISAEQSVWRLPDTHSIIELVAHMSSWRIYACERLTGNAEYKVTDEHNFPQEKNWPACLQRLEGTQGKLLAAIENFRSERLSETLPNTTHGHSYYTLIHGVIHHDLYHTGQIVLIKKAGLAQSF